jgi:hypothetical protein
MEAPAVEQPADVEDVDVPTKQPEVPKTVSPAPSKPKNTFVTGQYGVKPTASMAAEKPVSAGVKPVNLQPQKEEEPQLDLSSVVEGATIYHKSFGAGTVSKLDKKQKHIRVTFEVGEKTFIFPDAFEKGFLRTEK